MTRRTRLVATLGPATDDPAVLEAVFAAGLDVARVNFSHGDAESHLRRIAAVRQVAERTGRNVAVMADLPGPKLRVRLSAPRTLARDEAVTFAMPGTDPNDNDLTITEPEVLADIRPGDRMLLDDGRLRLEAGKAQGGRLSATVVVEGVLQPNKGLNLPDSPLSIPAVTDRDRAAIEIAAKAGVDWVALSFVRTPEAAAELRDALRAVGMDALPILAKMERPEAVREATAIISAFDGIMVARGDLGVEIPLEQVPTVQKQLIALARLVGKPVITATEMLDSMQSKPRPTRAEVSDVANAIHDGTDAVMLSGETAVGQYPVEAISCMARITEEAERHLANLRPGYLSQSRPKPGDGIEDALSLAACNLASEVHAAAIITPTLSGRTARLLARYRPSATIIAPAPTLGIVRQLALVWGVRPVVMAPTRPGDGRMVAAVKSAYAAGAIVQGDRVVVLAGHPVEGEIRMPTLRVVQVGQDGASCEP